MTNIDTIIFDLGGVMIDWNVEYVYDQHYFKTNEEKEFFFQHVCTLDWNEEQDAGKPLHMATNERIELFPEWEWAIKDYYGRWEEMLGDAIESTVNIFKKLKGKEKYKFYALSNWSHETFPIALEKFDFLYDFNGRCISGQEQMAKPNPAFYLRCIEKFNINVEKTIFIDDNLRNIKAAKKLGIQSIHFQSSNQLSEDLILLGIL